LALLFIRSDSTPRPDSNLPARMNPLELLRNNRHLLPGTLGIFCYVGAEIAIASLLVNYLVRPEITGLGYEAAGKLVSVYWGCALIGRFAGIGLLRLFRPDRLLSVYAGIAVLLLIITIAGSGPLAAASVLLVGFFNSIMFPTIFALTLGHFPESEAPGASGVLCLGIVGGAVVSQAQGALADAWGIQASFTLPLLCYVYIIFLSITVLRPVTPRLQTEC